MSCNGGWSLEVVSGLSSYKKEFDKVSAMLCSVMEQIEIKSSQKGMGLFIGGVPLKILKWWRKHQIIDAKRLKREKHKAKMEQLRKRAVNKLTDKEMKALEQYWTRKHRTDEPDDE